MNDPHNTRPTAPDLAKAEPLFDALKAKAAAQAARSTFDGQLKRAERTLFLCLYCDSALAVWTIQRSIGTTSLKAGLFYGLLLLAAILLGLFISLWYWTVNTKISLLKDMKQLRLQVGQGAGPTGSDGDEAARPLTAMALSKRELWLWIAGLAVVFAMVDFAAMPTSMPELASAQRDARTMQSERTVAIHADGSGTVATRYSIPNDSLFPMERFKAFNAPRSGQPEFSDLGGHELTATGQPIPDHGRAGEWLTVNLTEPVMPGQRLFLKESANVTVCAVKAGTGNVWKFSDEQLWSYGQDVYSYRYSCRVELPVGAKLLSVSPRFVSSHHEEAGPEGRWTVVELHDRRPRNIPFRAEVTYSLP